MRFADIPGNEDVKRALVNMADSGRVAHAMLFFENEGCGAFPLVIAYLQYLNCHHRHDGDSCGECPTCHRIAKLIHPDVHFVFPTNTGSKSGSLATKDVTSDTYMKDFRALASENPYFLESDLSEAIGISGKTGAVSVTEAKNILGNLSLASVEDGWKAVVFLQPEKMNVQAANKLLKIVEEPPEKTLFLFITHNPDKVIQTIFSRCQSSRVLPLSREALAAALTDRFEVAPEEAEAVSGTAGGSIGAALQQLHGNEGREAFLDIFSEMVDALLRKDLGGLLDCGNAIAELDSREKQKAFCTFAGDCLRKIFLKQKGLENIAYASSDERELLWRAAAKLPATFCRKALSCLDEAARMVDRNVAQKIIFCDLVNRLFLFV